MFRIIPAAYALDEDLSVARLLACRIDPPLFGLSLMAVAAAAAPACFSPRRIEGGTPSRRTSHRDSRRCRARTSVGRYSWARYLPSWPRALHQRGSGQDRKSTRLNSSHDQISYAV